MELKEFIKESLVQIAGGIKDANDALIDVGGCVNPERLNIHAEGGHLYGIVVERDDLRDRPVAQFVEFDVAVAAGAESGAEGGLKVGFANLSIGGGLSETNTESSQSRLTFRIPMVCPRGKMG